MDAHTAENDAACPWCHSGDLHPMLSSCHRVTSPVECDKRGPGGECVRDHEPCPDFPIPPVLPAPECEISASCGPGDHTYSWPCAHAPIPPVET